MGDLVQHTPPSDGVTEIRVHGVGGANPSSMLGRTDIYQVTGDATAGFFRATTPPEKDRTVEAYSWGGLTARGRARALWVLLLPFALINLAGWMVEPSLTEDERQKASAKGRLVRPVLWAASQLDKWQRFLVHVTALALSGAYVMWVALMTMNLLAYQCGAREACTADRFYAQFLHGEFFAGHPGRRVVVGALVPLAMIALFAIVSKVSRAKYESYTVATAAKQSGQDDSAEKPPNVLTTDMIDPTFWYTNEWHARLFRVHVAWALAFLGGITAYAAWQFAAAKPGQIEQPGWAQALSMWTFFLSIAVAVLAIVYVWLSVRWEDKAWVDYKDRLRRGAEFLWRAGLAVMLLSLVTMWQMRAADSDLTRAEFADLWGFGWTPILLFALAVLGVLLFSLVEVAKWTVTCEISPGLFFIAIAGVMILAWPYAWFVFLLALAIALIARPVERQLCTESDKGLTDIKDWIAIAVPTAVLLLLQLLGRYHWKESVWGDAWPRLTPVLFSGAVLFLLFHDHATRVKKIDRVESPASWLAKRAVFFPLLALGVLAGVAVVLALVLDRLDPLYLAAYVGWMMVSLFWVAIQDHDGFRWNGPGAVSLFGVALTAGLFSGGVIRFVSLLTRDGYSLVSIKLYDWLTVGFVAIMSAALVSFIAWLLFSLVTHGHRAARSFDKRFETEGEDVASIKNSIESKVKNWFSLARGVEAIDVFIMHISMVVLFATMALVVHFFHEGEPIRGFLDVPLGPSWDGLVSISAWVALMIVLGAVLAVRSGLRDAGFRRQIGIIWDVTSFWPRHFHPFAPPSYAVRTVPELQARLSEAAESNGAVILSGHSQGSVVAFAAAASLEAGPAQKTALVTHGSPLRRFYAKFFPSYFREDLLHKTAQRLGPGTEAGDGYWLNFHRRTDPIAAPVFANGVEGGTSASFDPALAAATGGRIENVPDVPLDDPPDLKWLPRRPPPEVLWHLNYMADEKMSKAVVRLTELLDADRRP